MKDYRGTPLDIGDKVAIYWQAGELKTAYIRKIKGSYAKVQLEGWPEDQVSTKWKYSDCMVKL